MLGSFGRSQREGWDSDPGWGGDGIEAKWLLETSDRSHVKEKIKISFLIMTTFCIKAKVAHKDRYHREGYGQRIPVGFSIWERGEEAERVLCLCTALLRMSDYYFKVSSFLVQLKSVVG